MTIYSETFYREAFSASDVRPTIVLLHGWGASSDIWEEVLPGLRDSYSIRVIDLPGLGRSNALPETNRLSVCDALVEELSDLPEFHLVGWSLGGMLAVDLSNKLSEKVLSLSLIASNPCFIERDDWINAMSLSTYQAFKSQVLKNADKALSRFALLQTKGSSQARRELSSIKKMLVDSCPTALLEMLELLEEDYRDGLIAIECPILHILGGQDDLVPVTAAESLSKLNSNAVVECFETASHLPFLTYPERFVEILTRFVGSYESGCCNSGVGNG